MNEIENILATVQGYFDALIRKYAPFAYSCPTRAQVEEWRGRLPDFLLRWAKAFAVAYVVAVPVIYFLAPLARKLSGRFAEMP